MVCGVARVSLGVWTMRTLSLRQEYGKFDFNMRQGGVLGGVLCIFMLWGSQDLLVYLALSFESRLSVVQNLVAEHEM